jgi:hypothetical protein
VSTVSGPCDPDQPPPEGIRRPGDIPDFYTLGAIARLYHALTGRLADARHGIGEVLPKQRLAEHAIGALAAQHVMAERALHSRWANVVDALTYGATLEDIAAAMSLDLDEVASGCGRGLMASCATDC